MINKQEGIAFEFIEGTEKNNINLVFVHGSGCNKLFLKSIQEFVSEYNCYFIDLPGHGDSDDTGYNLNNYVNSVANFAKSLDNVILLGHSLGGTIVLAVTSKNIPSVKGSVILSSAASYPKLDKDFMKKIHNNVVDMEYVAQCFGNMDDNKVQETVATIECDKIIITDFFIDETLNIENCLKNIKIPTTIVVGEDEILTPIEYSKLIHDKVKNSKLVIIPKTRHMLPIVQRKEVSKLTKELINSIF